MPQAPQPPSPDADTPQGPHGRDLDSPAFPRLIRTLTVVLVANLCLFAVWLWPDLRGAQWTLSGLALFALAGLCILWMAWWIVHSHTRLQGDVLSQSWLWHKHVHAREAVHLKLVHVPALEFLIAPRLLVRRRGGGMTWIHSADAELLVQFAHRVAAHTGESAIKAR